MDRPPFRFGVQATNAASAREWRDTVRKVEDLGYSTLFLADHYLGPGPAQRAARTPRQDLAPIAAMAAAAAHTETVRIGCRVFCVDYHVPAVLAKEAATLDLLSDGRLEFGVGAGWSEGEYTAMGVEFDRPGRRIDKLSEVVALIKAHWQGEELDRSGEFVRVHGYAGRPRPVQQPHPPIMIGGGGRRVLSLAAREADIVSISSVPFVARDADGLDPEAVAQRRIGFVRAAAGERYSELDVESSPYFTEITDDPQAALAGIAKASGISAELLRDHPNVLIGTSESVAELLRWRRETLGVNYVTVQQSQIESFAPVVASLHGR
ncbi:F420-dependent oxidoreductase [Mycobacterium sp. 1100029.7]|nr:F420-dependent oxidoreductase [Mycobacterium sp. 1100029.7]